MCHLSLVVAHLRKSFVNRLTFRFEVLSRKLVKKTVMQNLTHSTPVNKLNRVKIGDEIVDEYNSQGKVVKIKKSVVHEMKEFLFHLDSRQTIYILSNGN